MIEQYKENDIRDIEGDLSTLKKNVGKRAKETAQENDDPTYEQWSKMFDGHNIFKIYGNTIFLGKDKEGYGRRTKGFIEALCKYTASMCKLTPTSTNKTLAGEMIGYDEIRKMKENDPSNKLSDKELDNKYSVFTNRIQNLDNPENLEYLAQILARTMPKDGAYGSIQITTNQGEPPIMRIYEANIFQETISERFNIRLGNPELTGQLLTKMFSYIDTATNKTNGEGNYMRELFQ